MLVMASIVNKSNAFAKLSRVHTQKNLLKTKKYRSLCLQMVSPNEEELAEQKMECAASLAEYNDGTWVGYAVNSFSFSSK